MQRSCFFLILCHISAPAVMAMQTIRKTTFTKTFPHYILQVSQLQKFINSPMHVAHTRQFNLSSFYERYIKARPEKANYSPFTQQTVRLTKEQSYKIFSLPESGVSIQPGELKKIYHRLMMYYHPDKHTKNFNVQAEAKTYEINQAYKNILLDQKSIGFNGGYHTYSSVEASLESMYRDWYNEMEYEKFKQDEQRQQQEHFEKIRIKFLYGIAGTVAVSSAAYFAQEGYDRLQKESWSSACLRGDVPLCTAMLEHKAVYVNLADEHGNTPLIICAKNGHIALAQLLLGKGADIIHADNNNKTALHYATENNHAAIVKILALQAPDILIKKDNAGGTPWSYILKNNNKELFFWILERLTEEIAISEIQNTVIRELWHQNVADDYHKNDRDILRKNLIAGIAQPHKLRLEHSLTEGDYEMMALILKHGLYNRELNEGKLSTAGIRSPIVAEYISRYVPLYFNRYTTGSASIELLTWLCEHGVSLSTRDAYGETPIFYVVDDIDKLKLLKKHGAAFDAVNNDGETLLFKIENDIALADYLVQQGIIIDAKNNRGETVLHRAVFHGRFRLAEWLCDHGADVNVVDDMGRTPLFYAKTSVQDFLSLFKKHKANLTMKDIMGKSLFHVFTETGHTHLMNNPAAS